MGVVRWQAKPVSRGHQKIDLLLNWLLDWHYSTREILCQLMGGIHPKGQVAFFKKLQQRGVIQCLNQPGQREQLIMLDTQGVQEAKCWTGRDFDYPLSESKMATTQLQVLHHLSTQIAVLKYTQDPNMVYSYRNLPIEDEHAKKPDAIIMVGVDTIGVEVELSRKSTDRIYRAFMDSIENLDAEHYERVLYVFDDDALADIYLDLFNEPSWPVFDRDAFTYRLVRRKDGALLDNYEPDEDYRAAFEFVVMPLYQRYALTRTC
jgi:hypothetical protein